MIDDKIIEVLEKLASFDDIVTYMENHSVTVQDALLDAVKLLKQEPCDDAVSRDCNNCAYYVDGANDEACDGCFADEYEHPNFKPKAQYCDDCVSRQAVLEGVDTYINKAQSTGIQDDFYSFAELVVKALPPVTPQPKTGHWIEITNQRGTVIALRCSACEKSPKHAIRSDYCPNCGAKMIEPAESEEQT